MHFAKSQQLVAGGQSEKMVGEFVEIRRRWANCCSHGRTSRASSYLSASRKVAKRRFWNSSGKVRRRSAGFVVLAKSSVCGVHVVPPKFFTYFPRLCDAYL